MGWQDDQVVSQAPAATPQAAAAQPAWAQDEVVSNAAPAASNPPVADSPSLLSRAGNAWLNFGPASVFEPAAQLASSMLLTPAAGIAGIASGGDADTVNKVAGMAYEPKTQGGKFGAAVVNYPFQKLGVVADKVGTAFGGAVPALPGKAAQSVPISYSPGSGGWPFAGRPDSPAIAATMNTAVQAIPAIFSRGRAKGAAIEAAEAPKPTSEVTPRQALVDELVGKGLKVTPTQAGAKVGSVVEGLSGHAKTERAVSLQNAKRVNELVGEDVGLKDTKEITQADINRLKVEANKPYSAIAQTGVRKVSPEYKQEIQDIGDRTGGDSFKADVPKDITRLKGIYGNLKQFTAQDAVNKIRQLRSEATKNIKAINAPEQNAKGQVQRAIAEALDNELTRHVESLGKPELAANYKAARVQLAKVHTLEDALDGTNVSASELAKAKDRGVPLTGNMDLVARAHTEFDRSFQNVSKVRDSSPFSVIDLGAGVAGASASPALTAAVLARPLARAVLTSDRYQRGLASGAKKSAAPRSQGVSKQALATEAIAAKGGRQ